MVKEDTKYHLESNENKDITFVHPCDINSILSRLGAILNSFSKAKGFDSLDKLNHQERREQRVRNSDHAGLDKAENGFKTGEFHCCMLSRGAHSDRKQGTEDGGKKRGQGLPL